jgi:hypothetical protein
MRGEDGSLSGFGSGEKGSRDRGKSQLKDLGMYRPIPSRR